MSPEFLCAASTKQIVDQVQNLSCFDMQGGLLYWASGGSVVRRNGATTEAVVVYPYRVDFFRTDASSIYFLSTSDGGTTLYRMNLDRTGLVELTSDIGSRFVMDDERIYFDTLNGTFSSIAKTGGPVEPQAGPPSVWHIYGNLNNRGGLIDATHLYWAEGMSPEITLKRVVKRTTQIETVADHLPGGAVQLEGDGVLLADGKNILEIPKAGGCPKVLVSGTSHFVADAKAIYWSKAASSDTQDLYLYRAPRTGGVNAQVILGSSSLGGTGIFLLTPTDLVIQAETTSYRPGIWTVARTP